MSVLTLLTQEELAVLLYLGLSFLWLEVPIISWRSSFAIDDLKTEESVQMLFKAAITQDLQCLNRGEFKTKGSCNWGMMMFERVAQSNVFVFIHQTYVACSSAEYNNFKKILRVASIERKWEDCTQGNHYALQPFFMDNMQLQLLYATVLCGDLSDSERQFVSDQKKKLDKFQPDEPNFGAGSCFVTGGDTNNSGVTFRENTWTQRLCACLKLVVTDELKHSVHYTAEDGPLFQYKQAIYTGLPLDFVGCYPFRGAPDVTIKRRVISQLMGGGPGQ